jgi:hypothetical protein
MMENLKLKYHSNLPSFQKPHGGDEGIVLCRLDAKLQIHYHEHNSHACAWPEPPQICDVGVLRVQAHYLKHPLMGMHPSDTTWPTLGAVVDCPRLNENM